MRRQIEILIAVFFMVLPPVSALASTWAKSYGGSDRDLANSIAETSDGGFIVAGITASFGVGGDDFWVLKLDPNGNVTWQKTYGGSDSDRASSIAETSDNGFIVAGITNHYGGLTGDYWVLKLDSNGSVVWQKTYGGSDLDLASSIAETSDNGFIVAGTGSLGATQDYWVLKLNSNGSVEWQKTYGGTSDAHPSHIRETSDNGFIVAGSTYSFGAGVCDHWVLKLDSNGSVEWQKTYGGTSYDEANSIAETSDNGFIVAGGTMSFGAGGYDYWVLKLDSNGSVEWQKTYGGSSDDYAFSIQETSDNGFIVAGRTESFGAGSGDSWVLKLDPNGNVTWQKTYGGSDSDRANSIAETSDNGFIVAGSSYSFGAGGADSWVLKLDSNGNIPDCDLIGETYVSANDSEATVEETTVTAVDTTIVAGSTSASIENTDASKEEQCAIPNYFCIGFQPPMDKPVKVKGPRALPLKAELFTADGATEITGTDIIAPPVVQVFYTAETGGESEDISDDALPAGHGTEGNQFEWTYDGIWQYNLKTLNYDAPGTYQIYMVSGDESEYVIDSTCSAIFVVK